MRHAWFVAAVMLFATSPEARAQDVRAEETAIKTLIADMNAGKRVPTTPDRVFWSGALTKPTIGDAPGSPKTGAHSLANRVPGSQKTTITPVRIEVARSGDMAWEFSHSHMGFALKDGKSVEFDQSLLRVWRKDATGWKIAATFVHPHEE
jgi:hypothetical protein